MPSISPESRSAHSPLDLLLLRRSPHGAAVDEAAGFEHFLAPATAKTRETTYDHPRTSDDHRDAPPVEDRVRSDVQARKTDRGAEPQRPSEERSDKEASASESPLDDAHAERTATSDEDGRSQTSDSQDDAVYDKPEETGEGTIEEPASAHPESASAEDDHGEVAAAVERTDHVETQTASTKTQVGEKPSAAITPGEHEGQSEQPTSEAADSEAKPSAETAKSTDELAGIGDVKQSKKETNAAADKVQELESAEREAGAQRVGAKGAGAQADNNQADGDPTHATTQAGQENEIETDDAERVTQRSDSPTDPKEVSKTAGAEHPAQAGGAASKKGGDGKDSVAVEEELAAAADATTEAPALPIANEVRGNRNNSKTAAEKRSSSVKDADAKKGGQNAAVSAATASIETDLQQSATERLLTDPAARASGSETVAEPTSEPNNKATRVEASGQEQPSGVRKFAAHLARKEVDQSLNGPRLSSADRVRFVNRVARAFESAQARDGDIRIRLSPPELGSLRLHVKVEGSVMSARLEAETPAARGVLMDNLPALRERLAEQGIRIEQFDIDLMDRQSSGTPEGRGGDRQSQQGKPSSGKSRSASVGDSDPSPESNSPGIRHNDGQLNVIA